MVSVNHFIDTLPIEIIRDIVEFACRNDAATAARLDRVCFAFRQWIGPLLYQVVVLHDPSSLIGFIETVLSAPLVSKGVQRDRDFYATYVEYVSIRNARLPAHHLHVIYEICTGIKTLELDDDRDLELVRHDAAQPRELILTRQLGKFTENVPMLSELESMWIVEAIPLPPTRTLGLQRLGFSIRVMELYWLRKSGWFARIKQELPALQMLVINLSQGQYLLSRRTTANHVFSPSDVWATDIMKDVVDSRIYIRPVHPSAEQLVIHSRELREDLWTLALRDAVRHPDVKETN